MNELDKLLQSTPIDELLEMDFSSYKDEEQEYLLSKVSEIADHKCFEVGVLYNIKDCELVSKLEDKLKLLELQVTLAYYAKINYDDVFSQVRLWDGIIYNNLIEKNIVVPTNTRTSAKAKQFIGAFVKEPRPGLHKWVVSYDVTSLYPSIMLSWNISPETIQKQKLPVTVDGLLTQTYSHGSVYGVAANGSQFDNSKIGFMPEIIQKMFDDRIAFKKKYKKAKTKLESCKDDTEKAKLKNDAAMFNLHQQARKIALNSLYGSLGTPYGRFFNIDMAEAVTLTGQFTIKYIHDRVNEWFQKTLKTDKDYVLYADTDSLFFDFSGFVNMFVKDKPKTNIAEFLSKVCESQLNPLFVNKFDVICKYMNAFSNKLTMIEDVIAESAIWTAVKKRYLLYAYKIEGVFLDKPELKIMGLDSQKSSTPEMVRDALKKSYMILVTQDEKALRSFIADFERKFLSSTPEEVSNPRGVNGLQKYYVGDNEYKKGTPIHVRGSLLYNSLLKQHNLHKKYEPISEGEKIRFCYLKCPNPAGDNVIAFPNILPKELGLDAYIDRDKQFDKTFVKSLKAVTDTIGWKLEDHGSLDDLFG